MTEADPTVTVNAPRVAVRAGTAIGLGFEECTVRRLATEVDDASEMAEPAKSVEPPGCRDRPTPRTPVAVTDSR